MNTPDITDLERKVEGLEGAAALLKMLEALRRQSVELEALIENTRAQVTNQQEILAALHAQIEKLGLVVASHQRFFETLTHEQPRRLDLN